MSGPENKEKTITVGCPNTTRGTKGKAQMKKA